MVDEGLARLRTHRSNIFRYRKLLNTKLLEHERLYILKRLSEEQSAIEGLASGLVPINGQTSESAGTANSLSPGSRLVTSRAPLLIAWTAGLCTQSTLRVERPPAGAAAGRASS
jgi:hypothetical protein